MNNIDLLLKEYTQVAIEHGEALKIGNNKVANRAYRKLSQIYKKLEKDHFLAEKLLDTLLQHSNYLVQGWAAAHALGLDLYIDKAYRILEETSKRQDVGIIRLEAETTLEEWQREGKLKF